MRWISPVAVCLMILWCGAPIHAQNGRNPKPFSLPPHLNFGVPIAPTEKSPLPSAKAALAPTGSKKGIDCAMVKPVDAKFHSNMPVIAPSQKVKLPIKTVSVPSCKG